MLKNTLNGSFIQNQKQDYQVKTSLNYVCSSRKHYTYTKTNIKRGLKKIHHVKINQKKSEVLIPVLKGKFQNNECYQS